MFVIKKKKGCLRLHNGLIYEPCKICFHNDSLKKLHYAKGKRKKHMHEQLCIASSNLSLCSISTLCF